MLKVSLSSSATGTGKLIGDPLDFKIFIKLEEFIVQIT